MKLYIDRQTKKGLFGGTYYETLAQVQLTPEERQIAQQARIMRLYLIGDRDLSSEETASLMHACNRSSISMSDLENGVKAKANNESQLGLLAWFEDKVREKSQEFKQLIEVAINNKDAMDQTFEDEI
jgi:hypothetical protein